MDHIDLTKGEWLILTRTTYRSDEISKQLRQNNLYLKIDLERVIILGFIRLF
jgi:hypothetical protein